MEGWGLNPVTLSAVGTLVGALGVIVALAALVFSERQTRTASMLADEHNSRSNNLMAVLEISADIRHRWENGWQTILRDQAPNLDPEQREQGEVGRQLTYMLNWLDWMGLMVRRGWIDRELLFGSLDSVIQEILTVCAHRIQADLEHPNRGPKWWDNVLFLAQQPEINVDITLEAEKQRRRSTPQAETGAGAGI